MTQRHFVTRWLGALGVILSVVSQGTTSAQTSLAATRQSAEQGDAAAQYYLGFSYDYGLGVPQDDAQALTWYRIAADQGHAAAGYNLGVMYANGEGVAQDFTEAVAWYRKAAEQGHVAAGYNLGVMYAKGEGVPEDDTQALAWLREAADEGDVPAQYMLGVMYARGGQATGLSWRRTGASPRGVSRHGRGSRRPKDYVEAHRWFNLAASHVTVTSDEQRLYAEMRDRTAKQMTPAQLAEAQKRAAEWQVAFELWQDERLLGSALDSQQR